MPDVVKRKKSKRIARNLANGASVSLTITSKMPCYSWSIPAVTTCPSAKMSIKREGSNAICGECYATGGSYNYPSTVNAQNARRAWIAESLAHDDGDSFVAMMTDMIRESVQVVGRPLFRGHDAGDFFSVPYIRAWHRIALQLPNVLLWFPTRSWAIPALADELEAFGRLPNVTLRPSALAFDTPAPKLDGYAAGSTVITSLPVLPNHYVCPTGIEGNPDTCEGNGCFHCWDKTSDIPTAYIKH